MKFEVKDFKVDILMNSSSLNKGKNSKLEYEVNTKGKIKVLEYFQVKGNSIRQSSNTVKSQSGGNEQTSS
ncbi:hypothetical protein [Bacillus sp. m3-13]|uniref:hypothetical protein n=1 Tax=Bacillus sp. m3-13 TaxID=406124 RepID=UPI0001E8905E|nr:hypothetical protein [Bacillus sp. m3-13]